MSNSKNMNWKLAMDIVHGKSETPLFIGDSEEDEVTQISRASLVWRGCEWFECDEHKFNVAVMGLPFVRSSLEKSTNLTFKEDESEFLRAFGTDVEKEWEPATLEDATHVGTGHERLPIDDEGYVDVGKIKIDAKYLVQCRGWSAWKHRPEPSPLYWEGKILFRNGVSQDGSPHPLPDELLLSPVVVLPGKVVDAFVAPSSDNWFPDISGKNHLVPAGATVTVTKEADRG